uniref:Uncharacterized protein n=1 Tax=Opuntia streptacantha TaxID=393608 RepID=A0A7C9DRD3_OPUST
MSIDIQHSSPFGSNFEQDQETFIHIKLNLNNKSSLQQSLAQNCHLASSATSINCEIELEYRFSSFTISSLFLSNCCCVANATSFAEPIFAFMTSTLATTASIFLPLASKSWPLNSASNFTLPNPFVSSSCLRFLSFSN